MKVVKDSVVTVAVFVWLIIVLFFYFKQSPALLNLLIAFIQQYQYFTLWHTYSLKAAAALGIAVWLVWVVYKCGAQLLCKLLPESELSGLERVVFSAGLGIGIVSIVTFALGVIGLWYVSVFWGVLVAATLAYPSQKNTAY